MTLSHEHHNLIAVKSEDYPKDFYSQILAEFHSLFAKFKGKREDTPTRSFVLHMNFNFNLELLEGFLEKRNLIHCEIVIRIHVIVTPYPVKRW